jgi:hypothetical protein
MWLCKQRLATKISPSTFPTNHLSAHEREGGKDKHSAGEFYNHERSGNLRAVTNGAFMLPPRCSPLNRPQSKRNGYKASLSPCTVVGRHVNSDGLERIWKVAVVAGLRETTKPSSIAGVPSEIRTKHLLHCHELLWIHSTALKCILPASLYSGACTVRSCLQTAMLSPQRKQLCNFLFRCTVSFEGFQNDGEGLRATRSFVLESTVTRGRRRPAWLFSCTCHAVFAVRNVNVYLQDKF